MPIGLQVARDRRPRAPRGHGEISTGTGRNRAEQVDLGQELEVIAFFGWAGFHEVAVILVESSDLEDVQDVVDVRLVEMPGQHGASDWNGS